MRIENCEHCRQPFSVDWDVDAAVHNDPDSLYHRFLRLSPVHQREVLGLGSQVRSFDGVPGGPIELNGPIGSADQQWGVGNGYGCEICGKMLKGSVQLYEAYDERYVASEGTVKMCQKCFLPELRSVMKLSWHAMQRLTELS